MIGLQVEVLFCQKDNIQQCISLQKPTSLTFMIKYKKPIDAFRWLILCIIGIEHR